MNRTLIERIDSLIEIEIGKLQWMKSRWLMEERREYQEKERQSMVLTGEDGVIDCPFLSVSPSFVLLLYRSVGFNWC